jgi:hypothetical protein
LNKSHIISTGEDSGLRIESFAVIYLRGFSTNKKYYIINLSVLVCCYIDIVYIYINRKKLANLLMLEMAYKASVLSKPGDEVVKSCIVHYKILNF